jgi:glutaminyl-peptide cyclotransferase
VNRWLVGAVLVALASPIASAPPTLSPALFGYQVRSVRPHDPDAFTQGLVLAPDGRLFESTGLVGRTTVRQLDPLTGEVLQSAAPEDPVFGEGLAMAGDRLIQLTWQEEQALVWDADTLQPIGSFDYEGEGWGLCYDGTRLVMSDGTSTLTFRDPDTFEPIGEKPVTLDGRPIDRLNELECVDGSVWANVWETDSIVRINPSTGEVTGVLDASSLITPHPALFDRGAVLNGMAYDPDTGNWLLTGKLWPAMFEVSLVER